MPFSCAIIRVPWRKPRMRGFADLRSSMLHVKSEQAPILYSEDSQLCLYTLERRDGE